MRPLHSVGESEFVMAKMNIVIGKGNDSVNMTTAKAVMRDRVNEVILAALAAEFGEAGMVRIVSESTGRGENLVGGVVADISENGGIFDGCITVKVTVKEWAQRVGTKAVKEPWDYVAAREEFDTWTEEETAKKAEKEAAKVAKRAADEAARAKRKAEAEARKANK